jgi:hypothetical protein
MWQTFMAFTMRQIIVPGNDPDQVLASRILWIERIRRSK